jgi:polyhydroxybutyrate depolymerase
MIARRSLAAALGLSALLAACGAGEKTARAPAAPAIPVCPGAGKHLVKKGTLYVPPGAKPRQTPLLVVVIPGGGGDEGDRLGIVRAARKIGFGVLYPTSEDGGFWQLNDAQGTSDVTDVRDAIEDTLATLCFDRRRVSITGVSNGAGFAARMACEHPEYFAAVAPVAAGYRALDPCPASARMSFLDIHGTADTVVPYNGKKPDRKGSVPRNTARWAKRDDCSAKPRLTTPRRLVAHTVYRGCGTGLRVEAFRLTGTDHGWPGHKGGRLPRHNPSGFNATTAVLSFVRTARKPAS